MFGDIIRLDPECILWPEAFAGVRSPPPELYVVGDGRLFGHPAVSIVGTRRASPPGLAAARSLATRAVAEGIVVVSGLALGIDAEAHRATLDAGGRTIAVLAHGLHMLYPRGHVALARRIVESGGLLVSEYMPGVMPQPKQFVLRDRVQAALSRASVVVESSPDGGAMHHARFALEMGRPVVAIESEALGFDGTGAREMTFQSVSRVTGRQMLVTWAWTRVVFPHLLLDGHAWKCVAVARPPREDRPVYDVLGLCDALEWMLASYGHRHVGRVVVVPGAPDDGLVWTNRPRVEDTESDPVRFDAPELELRVAVHSSGDVYLIAGGSLTAETDQRIAVMRRLVRTIDEAGWAVQRIDARGVHVARVRA